jgi:chromosome segregation ATPase
MKHYKKKIEEYEEIIKNNKYNIEKLSDEKIYIDNAKKTSEDRLKQKIENIESNYTNEINKIKNNYETEIKRIKNELDLSKMDYLKMTENSKENLNKMITERTKEKSYYDNVINKLKEDIANKSNENEKLLFLTKNLQQSNEDLNEKVIKMNDEINQKEKEQKEMLKSINKIQKEKNEIIRTNSKLNSVIYGRFKKREKSKSKEY